MNGHKVARFAAFAHRAGATNGMSRSSWGLDCLAVRFDGQVSPD